MDEFENHEFDLDEFIKYLDEDKDEIKLVNYESYPAINVEMLEKD